MSKEGFTRQQVARPSLSEDPKQVPDPDQIERLPQSRPPTWAWMLIFVGAVVALMVMLYISGARSLSNGSFFIAPVMLMSMVMMMRGRHGGDKKNRPASVNYRRAAYLRALDELRTKLHNDAADQAREIAYRHPDPTDGSLLTLVGSARMWECSPSDRNFGHVRVGTGMTRLHTGIEPPAQVPPQELLETVSGIAARDFLLAQNVVHDVARPIHLFDQPGWALFAELEQRPVVQGVLRSLVCQLAVFHGPDDVRVAIITDDEQAWEWAKWLPHTGDPLFVDACGQVRMIFGDVGEFVERFGVELGARDAWSPQLKGNQAPTEWLVVVVDYPGANCAPILGATGYAGVSVIEATNDETSPLARPASAFQIDEDGNVLKSDEAVRA